MSTLPIVRPQPYRPTSVPSTVPGSIREIHYPDGRTILVELLPVQIAHACPLMEELRRSRELLELAWQTNATLWQELASARTCIQSNIISLEQSKTVIEKNMSHIFMLSQELESYKGSQQNTSSSDPQPLSSSEEKMSPRVKRPKVE
jgi:hypothetical protein